MIDIRDIMDIIDCNYRCDLSWKNLLNSMEDHYASMNLRPDFQRDLVWTNEQKISFIEWMLRGGNYGRDIYFNCPGWNRGSREEGVLVDGMQRLHAAMEFMRDEIRVFKGVFPEYPDGIISSDIKNGVPFEVRFIFHINNLKNKKDVLKWYIQLNTNGTPHSIEDIARVKRMLDR